MKVLFASYLTNEEWHKFDENEVMVLTDVAPNEAVIEYNEANYNSVNYIGIDYYIYPNMYYDMRKRIGWTREEIIKGMKEVYTTEEVHEYMSKYNDDNTENK